MAPLPRRRPRVVSAAVGACVLAVALLAAVAGVSCLGDVRTAKREEAPREATEHFFEAVFSGSAEAADAYFTTSGRGAAAAKITDALYEDPGAHITAVEATELEDGNVRVTAIVERGDGEETTVKLEWEHRGRSPDDWAEWYIVAWE